MGEVLPLPSRGEVFEDLRGEGRTLRVSWHTDERTLVLSMWHLGQCRATFRLPSEQVPDLVRSLVVAGLTDSLGPVRAAEISVLPTAASAAAPDEVPGEVSDAPSPAQAPPALFLAPGEHAEATPAAQPEQPG